MEALPKNNKAVLYVDDEEHSLKYFKRAFETRFQVYTASNAREGLKVLETHWDKLAIIMSDQRMPGEQGVWLLQQAREKRPEILRIFVTAYSDVEAAITAVNQCAVHHYITKPWDLPSLASTLEEGMELFELRQQRDALVKEKMAKIRQRIFLDRMSSMQVLSTGFSHHIRNALVPVRAFLELTPLKLQEENLRLDQLKCPQFWKDFHAKVEGEIDRIVEMLNDLGLIADPFREDMTDPVSVGDLIESILEKWRGEITAKRIQIDNQIPRTLPLLTVNESKFRRLFELLLKDELVNLPPQSGITFRARRLTSAQDPAEAIRIEMQDNGPGIPDQLLPYIYDPFFLRSDQPQEFGINLMAAYFIVTQHGGDIEVQSSEGKGTLFAITIPIQASSRRNPARDMQQLRMAVDRERLWKERSRRR